MLGHLFYYPAHNRHHSNLQYNFVLHRGKCYITSNINRNIIKNYSCDFVVHISVVHISDQVYFKIFLINFRKLCKEGTEQNAQTQEIRTVYDNMTRI